MHDFNILYKYSSFTKLCRVVAYCHWFYYNLKKIGFLEVTELQQIKKTVQLSAVENFFTANSVLEDESWAFLESLLKLVKLFLDKDGLSDFHLDVVHSDTLQMDTVHLNT